MASNEDHWDFDEIKRNTRGANSYWYWKDRKDRPVMECQDARDVLVTVGYSVEQLRCRSPNGDPPDCEALVNGQRSGIEVTELADQATLETTIQAKRQFANWLEAMKRSAFRWWEQGPFRTKLQTIIDEKDEKLRKAKGGPYAQLFLVIFSNEFALADEIVAQYLHGATFQCSLINHAYLALPPAPTADKPSVFKLELIRRSWFERAITVLKRVFNRRR